VYSRRLRIFDKPGSDLKILGARKVAKTSSTHRAHSFGVTCEPQCYVALCAGYMWTDSCFCIEGRKKLQPSCWKCGPHRTKLSWPGARDLCTPGVLRVAWVMHFGHACSSKRTRHFENWICWKGGQKFVLLMPSARCGTLWLWILQRLIITIIIIIIVVVAGLRGGAFGWGMAPLAGRSRVRFPMWSFGFFIDLILPTALWL
jgi:hypothetical protein